VTWLVVIVGLVALVFIHELGHFTMARLTGIKPRSFYIGFPPAIAKIKRNGIEYGIGAIPLGGLVRIPGMHRPAGRDLDAFASSALREQPALAPYVARVRRALDAEDYAAARAALPDLRWAVEKAELSPAARRSATRALREVDEGTGADAYWRQPAWKQISVIFAGPLANILVAFAIFFFVYATGAPSATPNREVAAVSAGTPAAKAGLQVGDRVVAVNGRHAATFDAVSRLIRSSDGRPVALTVERGGKTLTLGPRRTIHRDGRWIWGFSPATKLVSHPLGSSARLAASDCWAVVAGTGAAIGSIFGSHHQGQITSTVGIVRISQAALKVSFNWYLQVVGFVSMSLALLNLLPLLPLDGGHILFSVIEAVRRRALAREVYERVSVVGIAFIVLLMAIAFSSGNNPH
jgi:regulator of sigma E protease